jgi:hypothetical protein
MLNAFFVFHYFPALEAKDVSVALLLRPLKVLKQMEPFFGIFGNHGYNILFFQLIYN